MPIKITNELLDMFARMSPDEGRSAFESLKSDEDRHQLLGAMKLRKAGQLVGTPQPAAPEINRSVGEPAAAPVLTDEQVVANIHAGKTASGKPNPVSQAISQGDTASPDVPGKREMSNVAVTAAQETVGLPIAKGIITAAPEVDSPSMKVLGRDLLTRTAGPKIQEYGIDPATKQQGENTLANYGKFKVGPIEGSVGSLARGAVTELGNPVNAINPIEAGPGAALWKRILAAGANNAAQTAVAATATNAPDVLKRTGEAFLGGAAFHGVVMEPLTAAAKAILPKVIGALKFVHEGGQDFVVVQAAEGGAPTKIPLEKLDTATISQMRNFAFSAEELAKTPVDLEMKSGANAQADLHPYLSMEDLKSGGEKAHELYLRSQGIHKDMPTYDQLDGKVIKNDSARSAKGREEGTVPLRALSDKPIDPAKSRNTGVLVVEKNGKPEMLPITPVVKNDMEGSYSAGDRVAGVTDDGQRIAGTYRKSTGDGNAVIVDTQGNWHYVREANLSSAKEADILDSIPANSPAIEGTLPTAPDQKLLRAMEYNPRMSIGEAAKHSGLGVSQAAELLMDLEQKGLVKNDGGDWDLSKPPPPPKIPKPPAYQPKPKDYVYIEGRNGNIASEVLETKGNKALVRHAKDGEPEWIASSKLRPDLPPGIANIRQIVPESPHYDGPPPELIPQSEVLDLKLVNDLNKKVGSESALKAFYKGLENQRHRGPSELRRYMRELQASEHHIDVKQRVHEAINTSVSKEKRASFVKDVHDLALGKISTEDMGQKYGEIWNSARQKVMDTINEKNANEKQIVELGGLPEDVLARDVDTDQYVARKFWSYVDPDKWRERVPAVVMQKAVKHIVDSEPNKNWTPQIVEEELSQILKTKDPLKAFLGSPMGKKYNKALMSRKDIPEPVRALMGEIDNGAISLAESIGNQRAIIQNLKTWQDISQDPRYFSPGPMRRADGEKFIQLPFDKKQYGKAAGGFVDPDLYSGLSQVAKSQALIARFMRGMTGFVKGNQVATVRAVYNSTLGNVTSTAGMGKRGLNLSDGVNDLRAAYRAIKDYNTNPTGRGEGALAREAVAYGARWTGQKKHELGFKKALESMDKVYGNETKAANVFDLMTKFATLPYHGIRKYQEVFGDVLEMNDDVFRLANYLSARRSYMKEGMPLEDAARAAAADINEVFWNAAHVGKVIDAARSNGAGVVAPYLTAKTEDLRIWKNMAKRLVTRPDTRFRVLGTALAVAGATHMMNATFGDDDLGGKDNFTKKQQSWSPFVVALPFTEKGRRLFYDMTPHIPIAQFAQGHPDDALWRRALENTITFPVQGGAAEQPIKDFLNTTGLTRPFMPNRPAIEGDNGAWKTVELLWKLGAVPKLPGNIANEWAKTQPRGIYPPSQGPVTGVVRNLGPNIVTPPPNALARTQEIAGEIRKLQGDLAVATKSGRKDLIPGIIERIKFLGHQAGERK